MAALTRSHIEFRLNANKQEPAYSNKIYVSNYKKKSKLIQLMSGG